MTATWKCCRTLLCLLSKIWKFNVSRYRILFPLLRKHDTSWHRVWFCLCVYPVIVAVDLAAFCLLFGGFFSSLVVCLCWHCYSKKSNGKKVELLMINIGPSFVFLMKVLSVSNNHQLPWWCFLSVEQLLSGYCPSLPWHLLQELECFTSPELPLIPELSRKLPRVGHRESRFLVNTGSGSTLGLPRHKGCWVTTGKVLGECSSSSRSGNTAAIIPAGPVSTGGVLKGVSIPKATPFYV